MSVQYPFGFEIGNNEPIDSRFVFLDLAARDALLSINRYEGLISYVISEGAHYRLKGGITNDDWEEFGGTGGTSDSTRYASIENDVSVAADLIPDVFTNTLYAGITFEYLIVRETSLGRKVLKGEFTRVYNADGSDTFKSGDKIGDKADIGVTLELNPVSGKLEYTSTELLGTEYSGFIMMYNFRVLALIAGGEGVYQTAPIENNQTVPVPLISNTFPSTNYRGVIFSAFIHREVDGLEYNSFINRSVVYTTAGVREDGDRVGDNAGVTFTLDPVTGELRYTSTEMIETSTEYLGFINFYKLIPLKVGAAPSSSTSVSLPSSLTGQVELSDIYIDADNDGFDTMLLADARKLLRVSTAANGAFQLDIPAFMNTRGCIITVMDVGGQLAAEPLTLIFSGGATVMGAASVQLTAPNISYRFVYMDDTNDWRMMEGTGLGVNVLNGVPTGAIIPFAGAVAPAGYTLADGAEVSRTDPLYAALFAVLGTAWGAGDGTTTFRKPKLNGRTLRFVDNADGTDPDAATRTALFTGGNTGDQVGSYQEDQYKSHNHAGSGTLNNFSEFYTFIESDPSLGTPIALRKFSGGSVPLNMTSSSSGGSETRMKNANCYALIKL